MYQEYDEAVEKIIEDLKRNQFSLSVIYKHQNCYRSFKQYLTESHLSYSHDEAMKWLQSKGSVWNHPKYKVARLSLFQLDDLIKNGCISNSYTYENSSNYVRLTNSNYRLLLDNYLKDISLSYSGSYIRQLRVACSEFLIYISQIDEKDISAINHKNIVGYIKQSTHKTIRAKNIYVRSIRKFLKYLSDKGLVSVTLVYLMDRFAILKIIFIDNLSDSQKELFVRNNTDSMEIVSSKEYYLKAIEIDPNFKKAYSDVAVCYRKLDQYNQAIEYYLKAIHKRFGQLTLWL